ncbi:hypothetical protein WN943_003241 [Citrus x changshan-huyou]
MGISYHFVDVDSFAFDHKQRQGLISKKFSSFHLTPQILNLVYNKSEMGRRVNAVINKFAERGLRSLAVAYQEVPEGLKESSGSPWQFIGLIPLFDPPI